MVWFAYHLPHRLPLLFHSLVNLLVVILGLGVVCVWLVVLAFCHWYLLSSYFIWELDTLGLRTEFCHGSSGQNLVLTVDSGSIGLEVSESGA